MTDLTFSALKLVHNNLTNFLSTNDDKFDFIDSNRIPYAVKFNPDIENFFSVADENGFVKFFKSYPKLTPVKEFNAQKSCIYDLQWLNSHELACGGGDQTVSIFDANTCTRLALLKGHTESVRSITHLDSNPSVIATGSRDGSVLIFDVRFNRSSDPADSSISYIRAVNSIQKAHFVEDAPNHFMGHKATKSTIHSTNHRLNNVLRNKPSNSNATNHLSNFSLKRPSPVASVLFINDHLLVSAGAADGQIKIWDTRKNYTICSKKQMEQTPLYIFDNQIKVDNSMGLNSNSKTSKGYSNIVMNHSKTRLYANCLNSRIYEYNYESYNQTHTRVLNSSNLYNYDLNNAKVTTTNNEEPNNRYHTNQSNYIKSKISLCDNFILSGSSDFNAYIYSTSVNSNCDKFRKEMPVIILKGHTNEVTAVDWNPRDSNQIVTCSDDNTIRIWNVKREIDKLKSNECNFCIAETINEFEEGNGRESEKIKSQSKLDQISQTNCNDDSNYIVKIPNRKFAPHMTGIFDDILFTGYEFNNFMRKPFTKKEENEQMDLDNDLEKELCLKWKGINLETKNEITSSGSSSTSNSPTSLIIKSLENNFKEKTTSYGIGCSDFQTIDLKTPTSDMPKNILPVSEKKEIFKNDTKLEDENMLTATKWLFKRQSSSSTLLSTSTLAQLDTKTATKNVKKITNKVSCSPESSANTNDQTQILKLNNKALSRTPHQPSKKPSKMSTAKKRNAIESGINEASLFFSEDPKTPVSKRRLILSDNLAHSSQSSPKSSGAQSSTNPQMNSPIRTLHHYFSPKTIKK